MQLLSIIVGIPGLIITFFLAFLSLGGLIDFFKYFGVYDIEEYIFVPFFILLPFAVIFSMLPIKSYKEPSVQKIAYLLSRMLILMFFVSLGVLLFSGLIFSSSGDVMGATDRNIAEGFAFVGIICSVIYFPFLILKSRKALEEENQHPQPPST